MRNMAAERRDLGDHGLLVSRLDRGQHGGHDDRTHHRKRRRQADLKADVFRQHAGLARGDEIEIGGARLARIAELAEFHLDGATPSREREERKAVGRADRAGRIGLEKADWRAAADIAS